MYVKRTRGSLDEGGGGSLIGAPAVVYTIHGALVEETLIKLSRYLRRPPLFTVTLRLSYTERNVTH